MLRSSLSRIASRPPLLHYRPYALSRFPDRKPVGSGRTKSPPSPQRTPQAHASPEHANQYGSEERPSAEESPLWEESQNIVGSDPEEGLMRLLLESNSLVVTRQIEMLNIFIGFEQTNKYSIANEEGEPLGFIAEEPRGFFAQFSRQIFRTHRPFRAIIMDREGTPVLWIRRPFDWINSRMFVSSLKDFHEYAEDGQPVLDTFSEVQQRWHPWRRRYDLFLRDKPRRILSTTDEPQPEPDLDQFTQFAKIDEGLWAWNFALRDEQGDEIASVNRQFRGFGREIFTDTGQYFVNFTPQMLRIDEQGALHPPVVKRELDLRERALVLAMAVNVDFDYFSRHSEGGHGMGFGMWGLGGFGGED